MAVATGAGVVGARAGARRTSLFIIRRFVIPRERAFCAESRDVLFCSFEIAWLPTIRDQNHLAGLAAESKNSVDAVRGTRQAVSPSFVIRDSC